jgi:hypothetical protein
MIDVEVQVHSKNLTLPENKATLTAYAIPGPEPNDSYNYDWKLMSDQTTGLMENRQNQTVSLSQLQEGTYQFQVTVTGSHSTVHGVGFGNVSVLPRK